jgi:hypothetical protein
MDARQLLIDMLSRKVSRKIDLQIRERVALDVCVCCAVNPIWRDGNCRACDYEVQNELARLSPAKQLSFLDGLYASGKRIRPYEIRKYRKPLSEIAKHIKEAS